MTAYSTTEIPLGRFVSLLRPTILGREGSGQFSRRAERLVAWTQKQLDRAISYLLAVRDPLFDRVAEMEAHKDP